MSATQPDPKGHFGPYGGRYVPEVLMAPLEQLEQAYLEARLDPAFQAELKDLLANYAGRPTPLYHAKRLSESSGGANPLWITGVSKSSAGYFVDHVRERLNESIPPTPR